MTNRTTQEPTATPGYMHDGTKYDHPAYGMIGASRGTSDGTALFGTDFLHRNVVTITIRRASLGRELSRDWHHATGEDLISVQLSEAQWATFVSTLNIGDGVPCTLDRVAGKGMPLIPYRQQRDEHEREMDDRLATLAQAVDQTRTAIAKQLPTLSGKRREAVMQHLDKLHQDLTSNIPWSREQLGRHLKRVVESAKTEVSAYATSILTRLGIARLAEGGLTSPVELPDSTPTPKAITKGKDAKP